MRRVAAVAAAAVAVSPVSPALAAAADDDRLATRLDEAAIARAVSALPAPRQSPAPAPVYDWSRVTALAAGREVIIGTDAAAGVRRRVVAADASGITLIDLIHPQLPAHVARVGRDLLAQSPESLARVADGGTFVRDRVRLAPEGIFLDGQRVGDIETLLQHVARADVVEIRENLGRSSGGLMVVAMVLAPTGAVLHARSGGWRRPEPAINGGTVVGGLLLATGVVVGAMALKRSSSAGRSPILYQRP